MIRHCRRSHLLPATLFLFVVAGCLEGPAQAQEVGNIVGQIRVARGDFPADRIKVSLVTRGIPVGDAWADNEGKFSFYNLPGNSYQVIIEDEKYQPYSEWVRVDPLLVHTNFISIQLRPRNPAQPEVATPAVAGANPYLVDATQFDKQFPKKAVEKFEKGVRDQSEGKEEEAIKHFREALKLAPDFYAAHNNLGTIYLGRRDFPSAQAEFETVLKLNQSDSQACFNLGNVFLLTQRYDQAERLLEEGLRRQPNAALGHLLLGTVLAQTNRMREAEQELHKAQELDPLLFQVPLELVNIYLPQHRVADAIQQLKLFLKLFPANPLAPKARGVLARLEASTTAKQQ